MSISTWRNTADIAAGASLSQAMDMEGTAILGLIVPAGWTTANFTFQGSHDKESWYNIYDDDGTEVTVVAAASRAISVDLAAGKLAPWRYLKIRSGTSGVPVNQSVAMVISFVCKG
jgi:hypothetical protein